MLSAGVFWLGGQLCRTPAVEAPRACASIGQLWPGFFASCLALCAFPLLLSLGGVVHPCCCRTVPSGRPDVGPWLLACLYGLMYISYEGLFLLTPVAVFLLLLFIFLATGNDCPSINSTTCPWLTVGMAFAILARSLLVAGGAPVFLGHSGRAFLLANRETPGSWLDIGTEHRALCSCHGNNRSVCALLAASRLLLHQRSRQL
uniref:Receptor for retinol uptake STRA6 n=1 Tax=Macrostomum lignano TaxID=282301 RepID=A0A1I8FEK8_9PLAT